MEQPGSLDTDLFQDALYAEAQRFLDARDWQPAEGLLWQLQHRYGAVTSVWIDQPLGLTLVMQGQAALAWQVLQPWLEHPARNFWVAHLAADALRALSLLRPAAALYRQALADGSNSAITSRNLLQVLWQVEDQEALAQLQHWQQNGALQGPVLAGIREALAAGQALALDAWCEQAGLATADQRRRLLAAALRRLDREQALGLLKAMDQAREHPQLVERLRMLGITAGAVRPGPAAAAGGLD